MNDNEPLLTINLVGGDTKRRRILKDEGEKIDLYPEYLEWTGRYTCEEQPDTDDGDDDGESWKKDTAWKTIKRDWRQRLLRAAIVNLERERNEECGTWDISLWVGSYPVTIDVTTRAEADQVYEALAAWLDW